MPSGWLKTRSVNLAAALSTLGIPLKADQSQDLRSGKQWKMLLVGVEALPTPQDMGAEMVEEWQGDAEARVQAAMIETPNAGARIQTKMIMEFLRTGKLEQTDPTHPVLDALRAIHNRECLLNWIKKDTRYALAKARFAPRTQLELGEESETVKTAGLKPASGQAFRTGDIKIMAALSVFGIPIGRIEGHGDEHKFVAPNIGRDLGVPPVDAHELVKAYRADTLPADHPFRWAMQALINREMILDYLHHQTRMILIRKPGSPLGAIIREDATSKCMDKVAQHFRLA